ncbi:MAG TPA: hypothetical protein VNU48_05175 [Burkholderiaceae bacterium]|nr:hypothetical protein [Burkholderiaceae bacterium]
MTDSTFADGAPGARGGIVSRAAGWMGSALLAAGLLAGTDAVLAANANFAVTVTPVAASASSPAAVSVGRNGMTTYAAYQVSITNSSGNTSNAIRFSASTDVGGDLTANGGNAGALAPYVETDPTGIPPTACQPTATGVQCNFGQMKNGDKESFVLIFAAPKLGDADHWAVDANITLSWALDYSSGGSSGSASSAYCTIGVTTTPINPCVGSAPTKLVTTLTDDILSSFVTYIPSFGGTFFTGNGASVLPPAGTDLLPTAAIKVTVPTGQNLTTAQADLTVVLGSATSATTTTNTAVIQIPNNNQLFGSYATIELRRDASTIASGAKIANAAVLYTHDDTCAPTPSTCTFNPLPPCPVGGVPTSSAPVCEMLSQRTEFTKKNAPTPADVGDWLFVVHALENGVSRF